jgi:hypothetical protein
VANLEQVKKALYIADVRPYESAWSSTAKGIAQRQLYGRTRYVDDDTLRFFGARINETKTDANGLWFALRESLTVPGEGCAHRWAVFDVFGCCTRTENCSNAKQADKLVSELINGVDWTLSTKNSLMLEAMKAKDKADKVLGAL